MELPPTLAAKSVFIRKNFDFIRLFFPRTKETVLNERRNSSKITALFVTKFSKETIIKVLLKSVHEMHTWNTQTDNGTNNRKEYLLYKKE
jgi:hypothetical protein